MKFCRNCGAELGPDAGFCSACGAKVEPGPVPKAPASLFDTPQADFKPWEEPARPVNLFAPEENPQQPQYAPPPLQQQVPPPLQQEGAPMHYAPPSPMRPPGGNAPMPPLPVQHAAPPVKKKTSLGLIVGIVLLFVVAVFGTVLVMLYMRNRPKQAIDSFMDAVAMQNVEYLQFNTAGDVKEWEPFLQAFDTQEQLDALRSQLELGGDEKLSAVTLQENEVPVFLFIKGSIVNVSTVHVFIPQEAAGTRLQVDGVLIAGEYQSKEQGMLYTGIAPGVHSAAVERGGVLSAPQDVIWLQQENTLEVEEALYSVSVSGIISDDAEIYVNGMLVDAKVFYGVVELDAVPLQAEIKAVIVQSDGTTREASIRFTDSTNRNLAFGPFSGQEPAPPVQESPTEVTDPKGFAGRVSEAEVNQIITEFYSSYIDCINSQSLGPIKRSTSLNNDGIIERMGRDGNRANEFRFISASCDIESFINADALEPPVPKILVNASMQYEYRTRGSSGGYTSSDNKRSYELLYIDGEWKVNNFVDVSDAAYASHQLGDFTAGN